MEYCIAERKLTHVTVVHSCELARRDVTIVGLSRTCQVIISLFNRTALQHIGQERMWSCCHERRQTSSRRCCGLQTVPTSIQSITKFGAFSKSVYIVARYVTLNI